MLNDYLPVIIYALVALGIGIVAISATSFLGPRRKSRNKFEPYECGMEQLSETHRPVSIKFYAFALLFILFDIETIFLLPWALNFREFIGTGTFWSVFFFLGVLGLGLVYILRTGALEWE